jgi:Ca2+-binding RTX toxin-like protein
MSTVLRGTAAADTISAASVDGDVVWGTQGDDNLMSGPGPDVFRFDLGDGQDWIDNFTVGVDRLQFGSGLTAANLLYMNLSIEGVPGLAVIYGGELDFVFLAGVTATSLSPADLVFAL